MLTNVGKQCKEQVSEGQTGGVKGGKPELNSLASQKKKKVKSTDPVKLPA